MGQCMALCSKCLEQLMINVLTGNSQQEQNLREQSVFIFVVNRSRPSVWSGAPLFDRFFGQAEKFPAYIADKHASVGREHRGHDHFVSPVTFDRGSIDGRFYEPLGTVIVRKELFRKPASKRSPYR